MWNRGNYGVASELVAPGFVRHDPDLPLTGIEKFTRLVEAYRGAFDDLRFSCEDLVAEGDKVLVLWKARASIGGRREELAGADLLRIVEGKIVESWPLFDGLRLLRKMGLIRFAALVRRLRRAISR